MTPLVSVVPHMNLVEVRRDDRRNTVETPPTHPHTHTEAGAILAPFRHFVKGVFVLAKSV